MSVIELDLITPEVAIIAIRNPSEMGAEVLNQVVSIVEREGVAGPFFQALTLAARNAD